MANSPHVHCACRMHKFDVPRIPHLKEFLNDKEKEFLQTTKVPLRKGWSYKLMLGSVFTSNE